MSGAPQIGAGQGLLHLSEPVPKLPHLDDPRFSTRVVGTENPALPTLFVFADVLEEICYRTVYEPTVGAACILLGGWFVGPNGRYLEIDGFRDFLHVSDPMRLLNTLRSQPSLLDEEDGIIMGCAQIQPGSGGRMSATHLILQNTFFNGPHQVLLLVDPEDEHVAFYQRDAAGLFHNVAFTLLNDVEEAASEDESATVGDSDDENSDADSESGDATAKNIDSP